MNPLVLAVGILYLGAAVYSAVYEQRYAWAVIWLSYSISAFILAYMENGH